VVVLAASTAVTARAGVAVLVRSMTSAAAPGAPVSVPAAGVAAAARVGSMAAAAAFRARGRLVVLAQRVTLHDVLLPDVASSMTGACVDPASGR